MANGLRLKSNHVNPGYYLNLNGYCIFISTLLVFDIKVHNIKTNKLVKILLIVVLGLKTNQNAVYNSQLLKNQFSKCVDEARLVKSSLIIVVFFETLKVEYLKNACNILCKSV
jgi:hypothetical protein